MIERDAIGACDRLEGCVAADAPGRFWEDAAPLDREAKCVVTEIRFSFARSAIEIFFVQLVEARSCRRRIFRHEEDWVVDDPRRRDPLVPIARAIFAARSRNRRAAHVDL